jgi:hypothetical protein
LRAWRRRSSGRRTVVRSVMPSDIREICLYVNGIASARNSSGARNCLQLLPSTSTRTWPVPRVTRPS